MKKILLIVSVFSLSFLPLGAQNKTWLGMEAAITRNLGGVSDYGNNLESVGVTRAFWGINIRQDINRQVFIETGLILNYYSQGFAFKSVGDWGYGSNNIQHIKQIPLRLATKINLYKEKLYLVPVIGYAFCFNSDHGISQGESSTVGTISEDQTDSASVTYTSNTKSLTHTYSLLQTGLGLECKLFRTVILSLSANYYSGFKQIMQTDVIYSNDGSPYTSGRILTKGEYWSFGVALKYPVSELWQRNEQK